MVVAVPCAGTQVSSPTAQISILPASISENESTSISVPSASVYIVTSSLSIPSFLLAVIPYNIKILGTVHGYKLFYSLENAYKYFEGYYKVFSS